MKHHHAEYNQKHTAGGEPGAHDDKTKGEEHKDAPPTAPTKAPGTLFLKNKLEAETTTENAMETGYSKIWIGYRAIDRLFRYFGKSVRIEKFGYCQGPHGRPFRGFTPRQFSIRSCLGLCLRNVHGVKGFFMTRSLKNCLCYSNGYLPVHKMHDGKVDGEKCRGRANGQSNWNKDWRWMSLSIHYWSWSWSRGICGPSYRLAITSLVCYWFEALLS